VDCATYPILEFTGKDRVDLLHRLSTNDLLSVKIGQTVGTSFLTEKGRLVDYAYLLFRKNSVLALISPGNEAAFTQWIDKYVIMDDVHYRSLGNGLTMFSFIGPAAPDILHAVVGVQCDTGYHVEANFLEMPVIISRRPDFGGLRFDLIMAVSDKERILESLGKSGPNVPLMERVPYEAYRILRGIPAFGHEISAAFNPYETGLVHSINSRKGCYIGQEVIARLETYDKVRRKLVGLIFRQPPGATSDRIPLRNRSGEIGWITSASEASIRGFYCGLAIVNKEAAQAGEVLLVEQNNDWRGLVLELPIDMETLIRADKAS